ncbi:MAG: nuclease-related domain-containing protein [Anaerolineaceae bacterium]|nr:nuclease-related domain-containing protein [Anaerolineaceae bacterium]
MRVITNSQLVTRNRRLATYLFIFALGFLILSFVLTGNFIQPEDERIASLLPIVSFIVLPLALVSALISSKMTNQWLRRPRPEEEIPANLKGFSERSALFSYYHFPARHVLVCPQGIFAIITRYQEGYYRVSGNSWGSRRSILGRILGFFRMDGIGNPTEDARRAAQQLQRSVDRLVADVPVQPLIVFISERARLEIEKPAVPVLRAQSKLEPSLSTYLRDVRKQLTAGKEDLLLPATDLERITDAFLEAVADRDK